MIENDTIIFTVPFNPTIITLILTTLYNEGNATFIEIAKHSALDLNKKEHWNLLRFHLLYLEKNHFLEERHFLEGTVDYILENKGIEEAKELLQELQKKSLEE